ncbi:MAG: hypothetical protein ACREF9_15660 [Opitutaceae bacterium]
MAVLGPYHLILWPMWKGIGYFFPDTPFFVEVVAGYFLGGLGYVSIARYMLSGRVKQVFGMAP